MTPDEFCDYCEIFWNIVGFGVIALLLDYLAVP